MKSTKEVVGRYPGIQRYADEFNLSILERQPASWPSLSNPRPTGWLVSTNIGCVPRWNNDAALNGINPAALLAKMPPGASGIQ